MERRPTNKGAKVTSKRDVRSAPKAERYPTKHASEESRAAVRQRDPEATKAAILRAAYEEFASEGVAGARTEVIAQRAGVNKALIHYYFNDKDRLYQAVLEKLFSRIFRMIGNAIDSPGSPRDRILNYINTHFECIVSDPNYPRIMQRELIARGIGRGAPMVETLVQQHSAPIQQKLVQLIKDGMAAGEFRQVDPMNTIFSILGSIIFYFISAPVQKMLHIWDPLSPENLKTRRIALLDFIAHALFTDPKLDPDYVQRISEHTYQDALFPGAPELSSKAGK